MKSTWPRHRFFSIPQEDTVEGLSTLVTKVFYDLDETLKELFEHQIDLTQDVTGTLPVGNGGTGLGNSFTAHAVLVGEGTGAIATTGPGTLGQVLTSNGAASDPTFQALPPSLSTAQALTRVLLGT